MSAANSITFVSTVNNRKIFERNFLASPCFGENHPYQIIVQEGFSSAAKAYNDAIQRSTNDLIVFAHQDMVFPENWVEDLGRAIEILDQSDPRWGVLGCYGETLDDRGRGHVFSSGLMLGASFDRPAAVQTLDEIVLIIRKSTQLKFDERLPHFHFYGAEICMAATKAGRTNYAIPAFCVHNSQMNLVLPKEFYESYRVFKKIWKAYLPIQTTCIRVTDSDVPMYRKRLREVYLRYIRRKTVETVRVDDGRKLLESLDKSPAIETVPVEQGHGQACR